MVEILKWAGRTKEDRLKVIVRELERIAINNGAHWTWCEELSCRRPFMVGSGTGRRKTARFCSKLQGSLASRG